MGEMKYTTAEMLEQINKGMGHLSPWDIGFVIAIQLGTLKLPPRQRHVLEMIAAKARREVDASAEPIPPPVVPAGQRDVAEVDGWHFRDGGWHFKREPARWDDYPQGLGT